MTPLIARTTAVSVATATMELARRVQQGARGLVHGGIHRIELVIEPIDLLAWVRSQTNATKVYWRDRDGNFEIAGISAVDIIYPEDIASATFSGDVSGAGTNDTKLNCIGAFRFGHSEYENADDASSPYSCFLIPSIEITRRGEEYILAINYRDNESSRFGSFSSLMNVKSPVEAEKRMPELISSTDAVSKSDWCASVKQGLEAIKQGRLEKFVPARALNLTFDASLDPFLIAERMQPLADGCYLFALQLSDDLAFVGASPERLYSRRGDSIETESLAGTRVRGRNDSEDDKLAQELMTGEKELLEHKVVDTHIAESLAKLCQSVDADASLSVRKLARLQHLARSYRGTLKTGIGDNEIVAQLHPSPAVCGAPKEAALAQLEQIEPFDRGWYAGPVGRIGGAEAELAVGIRSAIIRGKSATLYAGAGVVAGSEPESEWDEIDQKIAPLLNILKSK
jgi:menaquinone-specific isochorismate synthase